MNLNVIAEKILGRNLLQEEGVKISLITEQEKKLEVIIPSVLRKFYSNLGNNILFTDGFQHFANIKELFINDNKLVFLQENQSVVYWAVDLTDLKTVYQTTCQDFDKSVEWFKEEFDLDLFIEMMLYYQCVMSDETTHNKAKSGFQFFTSLDIDEYNNNKKSKHFIDTLDKEYKRVVNGNGVSVFWNPETIIMCLLDKESQVSEMILSCTKSESVLDELIDEYGFGEL